MKTPLAAALALVVGLGCTEAGPVTPEATAKDVSAPDSNPAVPNLDVTASTNGAVITACYNPMQGRVYRIKEPGLSDTCVGQDVEFSWNEQGLQGPPGISGYEIVEVGRTITAAPGDQGTFVTATCPDGKKILGGGYSSGGFFTFLNSSPVNDNAWQVLVVNRHTTTFTAPVFVRAICAVVAE